MDKGHDLCPLVNVRMRVERPTINDDARIGRLTENRKWRRQGGRRQWGGERKRRGEREGSKKLRRCEINREVQKIYETSGMKDFHFLIIHKHVGYLQVTSRWIPIFTSAVMKGNKIPWAKMFMYNILQISAGCVDTDKKVPLISKDVYLGGPL